MFNRNPMMRVYPDGKVGMTIALSVLAELKFTPVILTQPMPTPTVPEIGRPVQFVSVPEEGVPRTGVVNVGDVARTLFPDPVSVRTETLPELSVFSVPL